MGMKPVDVRMLGNLNLTMGSDPVSSHRNPVQHDQTQSNLNVSAPAGMRCSQQWINRAKWLAGPALMQAGCNDTGERVVDTILHHPLSPVIWLAAGSILLVGLVTGGLMLHWNRQLRISKRRLEAMFVESQDRVKAILGKHRDRVRAISDELQDDVSAIMGQYHDNVEAISDKYTTAGDEPSKKQVDLELFERNVKAGDWTAVRNGIGDTRLFPCELADDLRRILASHADENTPTDVILTIMTLGGYFVWEEFLTQLIQRGAWDPLRRIILNSKEHVGPLSQGAMAEIIFRYCDPAGSLTLLKPIPSDILKATIDIIPFWTPHLKRVADSLHKRGQI